VKTRRAKMSSKLQNHCSANALGRRHRVTAIMLTGHKAGRTLEQRPSEQRCARLALVDGWR
jgi:hypothetical protein